MPDDFERNERIKATALRLFPDDWVAEKLCGHWREFQSQDAVKFHGKRTAAVLRCAISRFMRSGRADTGTKYIRGIFERLGPFQWLPPIDVMTQEYNEAVHTLIESLPSLAPSSLTEGK